MGHRHLFSSSQIIDADNDQGWNHSEQGYMHLARAGAPEGNTSVYRVENLVVDGGNFASQWNPAPRSGGYSTAGLNVELPHYQPQAPGPSHDPFLHPSPAEGFHIAQDNYPHHASSSNHGGQIFHRVDGDQTFHRIDGGQTFHRADGGQTFHRADGGQTFHSADGGQTFHRADGGQTFHRVDGGQTFNRVDGGQTFNRIDGGTFDLTAVSGRGPFKRKIPGLPPVCERGSTSRYYDNGTSSSLAISVDSWHEKQVSDSHQTPWDFPPSYSGHSLTIRSEDASRNVRSRTAFDLEGNPPRTHLSASPNNPIASLPAVHSSSTELWGQSFNTSTREWNQSLVNPAGHGRPFMSGNSSQSTRGVRSSYTQRSIPTFRASSSNLHPGCAAPSDEGLQVVAESHPARQSRPFSSVVLRERRSRITSDRYRSFPDEVVLRDRLTSEGLMIAGRPGLYGSRSPFDQHRDMRLDIDNMSYEELLALEERIGNVSTGLSDDLVSKCLTESVFCSSDQSQEEGKCVICLEEYKNMDDVGTLKACRHDFHVECIRKWLSVKNLCPICKASALEDKMKQKQ